MSTTIATRVAVLAAKKPTAVAAKPPPSSMHPLFAKHGLVEYEAFTNPNNGIHVHGYKPGPKTDHAKTLAALHTHLTGLGWKHEGIAHSAMTAWTDFDGKPRPATPAKFLHHYRDKSNNNGLTVSKLGDKNSKNIIEVRHFDAPPKKARK